VAKRYPGLITETVEGAASLAAREHPNWNLSDSVEILAGTHPTREKQIPRPAKSAGLRDDRGVGTYELRKSDKF
jgi:hypothetical protein